MNCKGQRFGHNFQYPGAECQQCGISQSELSGRTRKPDQNPFSIDKYKTRAKEKHQATYHQDLAVKLAEALDDKKSIGIFARLYKRDDHATIHYIRDWVLKQKNVRHKGRLFLSTFYKARKR